MKSDFMSKTKEQVRKYSLQGTTQGNNLMGDMLPVRFFMSWIST